MLARSRMIPVRGLRYHVRTWGDDAWPAIVCCHGWLDTGGSWQFVARALAGRYRIIAPDWRGFGYTSWAGDHYWFQDYVADLDILLDALSPDAPVRLVGHSMGAQATSLFAGVRPDRVARLVLMDDLSVPNMEADLAPKRLAGWLDAMRDPPAQKTYDSFQDLAARVAKRNSRLNAARALAIAHAWGRQRADGRVELLADPRHRMRGPTLYKAAESKAVWRQVTAPVLFLDAADSPFQHMAGEDEMAERRACFANGRRQVVADAGHMLHHDQPDAVADAIATFFDAV